MSDRWRAVAAALLNPDLRVVLGEAMAGPELTSVRRERATARLVEIGLLQVSPEGSTEFSEKFVRELLSEQPKPRPRGPQRYLDGGGRIGRYPVQQADRLELLRWVAGHAFVSGEVLTETETNERLTRFADDVAALRRHLVDAELLERTRSGSEYALVEDDGVSG